MKIKFTAQGTEVNGKPMDVPKDAIAEQLKYMLFGIPPKQR